MPDWRLETDSASSGWMYWQITLSARRRHVPIAGRTGHPTQGVKQGWLDVSVMADSGIDEACLDA